MVVGQLGALLMNWGRLEEARVASEEALEVFRTTGHRYREGVMLTNLARIAMEQGRLDDALEGGRRALQLTEEIDDAEGVVASLQSLGDGYRLAGDHRNRARVPERGLEESRHHPLPYFTAHLLASLAAVDLAEGRVDEALRHAAQAQEAAKKDDVPHAHARADLLAGMVRQDVGDPSAVELLRARGREARRIGVEADWVESLSVLALALQDAGDRAEARRVVEVILPALDRSTPPRRGPAGPRAGRRPPGAGERGRSAGGGRRARAADFLRAQAAQIRDDELRASFLAAPVNVRLARSRPSIPEMGMSEGRRGDRRLRRRRARPVPRRPLPAEVRDSAVGGRRCRSGMGWVVMVVSAGGGPFQAAVGEAAHGPAGGLVAEAVVVAAQAAEVVGAGGAGGPGGVVVEVAADGGGAAAGEAAAAVAGADEPVEGL